MMYGHFFLILMAEFLFDRENHHELTFHDVFMTPFNPAEQQLFQVADDKEKADFTRLQSAVSVTSEASERAISERGEPDEALQREAFLRLQEFRGFVSQLAQRYPDQAKQVSRDEVDLTPVDGFGNLPVVASNMNNVTGKRMAEAVALMGGSAAIPQDKKDADMRTIAEYLHGRDVRYQTPIVVTPETPVWQLQNALQKRPMDTAIVVDGDNKLVGLVRMQKQGETQYGHGVIPQSIDKDAVVGSFVRGAANIISAHEGIDQEGALDLMEKERVDFLPVVASDGTVKGVMTEKFAALSWRYKPHIDPVHGGLAMLATVGAINNDPTDRVKFLLDQGVMGIVFDTAHFDQGMNTYRAVEMAAGIIANSRQKVFLVAGNTVTREGTRNILASGANAAKVGVGPGAMCSTRMETGVGRPQFTAISECAEEAEIYGGYVWADGGIVHPRDVALALAAGASQVMIGSILTPTYESPTPFERDENGLYKINRGMASRESSVLRSIGKNGGRMRDRFRQVLGHRSEGISASRVYARPGLESAMLLIHSLMDGVTSSMTYAGARNLKEFRRNAHVGIQGSAGYEEGKPKSSL